MLPTATTNKKKPHTFNFTTPDTTIHLRKAQKQNAKSTRIERIHSPHTHTEPPLPPNSLSRIIYRHLPFLHFFFAYGQKKASCLSRRSSISLGNIRYFGGAERSPKISRIPCAGLCYSPVPRTIGIPSNCVHRKICDQNILFVPPQPSLFHGKNKIKYNYDRIE